MAYRSLLVGWVRLAHQTVVPLMAQGKYYIPMVAAYLRVTIFLLNWLPLVPVYLRLLHSQAHSALANLANVYAFGSTLCMRHKEKHGHNISLVNRLCFSRCLLQRVRQHDVARCYVLVVCEHITNVPNVMSCTCLAHASRA